MHDNHQDDHQDNRKDNHGDNNHKKKQARHDAADSSHSPHDSHAQHGPQDAPSDHQAAGLHQQIGELTEALQRERADALNMRRHHEEDMAGIKTRTRANVVRELLPVIDNFERALKHVPEDLAGNDYVKGVQGVVKQFEKTLADIGVERIKTKGEPFDPRFHEAVSMDEGEGAEEVVSEELQAGYRIGEDVIRHAMVRVTTR